MMLEANYSYFGDRAIRITFGETLADIACKKAVSSFQAIEKEELEEIVDMQICYNSILILYNPLTINPATLVKRIAAVLSRANEISTHSVFSEYYVIPTVYGGDYGPDLDEVAKYHGVTRDEVVRIHTGGPLQIYYPGATVCNLTPDKIVTPRRKTPRVKVPQGSVGIGGKHTGIYLLEDSPGGWNIIGRTPLRFFNPLRIPPFRFKIGDYLHYRQIGEEEYNALELGQKIALNTYSAESLPNGTKVFEVIEPGFYSIVQDIGRLGARRLGIPKVGPMDSFAFRLGNILVGNKEDEAALETTVAGPKLRAVSDCVIAITGGDLGFTINHKVAPMWQPLQIKEGDVIRSKGVRSGCRAYISISGGIDVPKLMGSKSTSVPYRMGGIGGRRIKSGDVLAMAEKTSPAHPIDVRVPGEIVAKAYELWPNEKKVMSLRVILGPFDDYFTRFSIETFLNSNYIISSQADRVAYRLEGARIEHSSKGADIVTTALIAGAIQVPGNGQPLIFLDERISGGYPVVAVIISADLYKLGQLKPGDAVRFQSTSIEDAHFALREHERGIDLLYERHVSRTE